MEKFHNGARLGPRSFLFVIQEESNGDYVRIHPDPEEVFTSRGRWKYAPYDAVKVHRKNLFQCAMSKFLLPFYIGGSKTLFLPTDSELVYNPSLLDSLSGTHFAYLMEEYEKVKKEGARQETLWDYIAYNGKTTNPLQTRRLKVIYNAIGRKRVKAAVLKQTILIDDSLYYYTPDSEAEAYYLATILNSNIVSFTVVNIKDERNIHKNPWRLPIPHWQNTPGQREIVSLGKLMEDKIQDNLLRVPQGQTKKVLEAQILRWIEPDLIRLDPMVKELFEKER
ncbi:MAG: putative BseRI endonuclease [Promethearchaeota archaeon CR_4]|nr:MAG: putative BseRI endonuclease [Candidatus Lokiarchaeota archaeon CR_4]